MIDKNSDENSFVKPSPRIKPALIKVAMHARNDFFHNEMVYFANLGMYNMVGKCLREHSDLSPLYRPNGGLSIFDLVKNKLQTSGGKKSGPLKKLNKQMSDIIKAQYTRSGMLTKRKVSNVIDSTNKRNRFPLQDITNASVINGN